MSKIKQGLQGLKKVNEYTATDLKQAKVTEAQVKEFDKVYHAPIPTRARARNLTKELLKEQVATVRALAREYGSTQAWAKGIKTSPTKDALCIMFSDWHVGKHIYDHNGNLRYSTEMACHLGGQVYADKIIEYLHKHHLAKQIDEVNLLLLGDLIDNEIIYSTQVHKIDMPVELQVTHAQKALLTFVDRLEQGLQKLGLKRPIIKIWGIRGNHGRVDKGALEVSSWETLIYENLDMLFSYMKKKNVVVNFSRRDSYIIDVKGQKGLLRHKAPPQAETSGAKAKLGGWNELFGWDWLAHGHFHHWGANCWNSKPVFRNGSFVGPDDLSEEMGVRDFRCQMIFGLNETECPSFMHRIVLGE